MVVFMGPSSRRSKLIRDWILRQEALAGLDPSAEKRG
jgi:hypothetical protein